MKEFKELIHATLTLAGYLFGLLMWGIMILACVALVLAAPILVVAAVYKIICLICHMVFCWEIPILIGIGIVALFGLTGLDDAAKDCEAINLRNVVRFRIREVEE